MDVRRLRLLRELADRGTVTAVANALSYTPSSVSQQIRALQAEVGVRLTEPAGRGLRLTDAGWALATRADEVLAALDRAEAELDTYRSSPRGVVRVAMFPSGAFLLLPGVLRRIAEHPQVRLEARDVDMVPSEVPRLTADFDLVVTHRDDQAPPHDGDRVAVTPLLREPLDVAMPLGHPLAGRERVELTELVGEPWLSVDIGFPVDDVLRSLAVRTGVRPIVVQRINDFRVTEALVAAGHGIALLPRYTVNSSQLVMRPLAGVRAGRNIEVVSRKGATERPAVQVALDALTAEARARTEANSPG
ncbi:LysR family transcriptional regulator [Saccharopolyspora aridisoli]|uniref:LysR family transcriptional regulator n=1 Tax=Saccharopolyspora aridisoli TaxID=2530385 RepID=A0A4R4USL6_9PSEU|nr:LysR substrate-binding domain-containing protein [Saccharopolyspora aridisoli]TDC92144.1 LysR family transcriptional regulator [Saccharopolyspora aridisoli]